MTKTAVLSGILIFQLRSRLKLHLFQPAGGRNFEWEVWIENNHQNGLELKMVLHIHILSG